MAELSQFEKDGVVYDLKDTTARKRAAESIVSPLSASIGQTIRVTEVDAAGRPTKWEAVDLPEQGLTRTYGEEIVLIDEEIVIPADDPIEYLMLDAPEEYKHLAHFAARVEVSAATNADFTAGRMLPAIYGYDMCYYNMGNTSNKNCTYYLYNDLIRGHVVVIGTSSAIYSINATTKIEWNRLMTSESRPARFTIKFGTPYSGTIKVKAYAYK